MYPIMHQIIGLAIAVLFLVAFVALIHWGGGIVAFSLRTLSSERGTVLSADKKLEYTEGVEFPFPVINADIIYAGGFVCVNAAGYALPGSDTAGLIFQGIALERVDNSSGAAGAKKVNVRRHGLIKMTFATAISQASVGDNAFLVDDDLVDVTAQVINKIFCGVIVGYIDTTHAYVDIGPANVVIV